MKKPYIDNYISGLNRLMQFDIVEIVGNYVYVNMPLAFAYSIAHNMREKGWRLNDKNPNKLSWEYDSGPVTRS